MAADSLPADSLPADSAPVPSHADNLESLRAEHRRNKLALAIQKQRAQLRTSDLLAGASAQATRDSLEGFFDASNYVNLADYLGDGPYGYGYHFNNSPWLATRADRDFGRNRPIFQTEQDLMAFRGMARLLFAYNNNAIGAIENMTSYVVGEGSKCRAQANPHCGLDAAAVKPIVSQVGRIIDDFIERNDWDISLAEEKFQRAHVDGEFFEGLWHVGDGCVDVRIVEPEQVSQPYDHREIEEWISCDHRRVDWTFGVCADDEDAQNVHGYYAQWTNRDTDWDFLPGGRDPFFAPGSQNSWCEHFKSNVPRNVKRGLTDFVAPQELLNLARKIQKNMGTATSISAAVAWVIQHAPGILTTQIQSMIQANAATSYTQQTGANSSRTNYVQQYNGGTVLHTGQNQEYKNAPGADNAPNYINVEEACLRSCAVRWSMPEHMITGSAENNNYASILEAGSPFVKRAGRWQARHVGHDKRVLWKVVDFNCQAGKIRDPQTGRPLTLAEVKRYVTIEVEPPRVEVRDDGAETTRNETLKKNGVMSRKTWAAREGLDFEQEEKNGAVDEEGQAEKNKTEEGGQPPGQPGSTTESNALEAVQHAPAGKPTAIGGKSFKPGQFIPAADMAKATPKEKAKLKQQQAAAKAGRAEVKAGKPEKSGGNSRQPDAPPHVTQTKSFKGWFGDWKGDRKNASKVVDARGDPLIVYHGTRADFDTFDKAKQASNLDSGDWGAGFYFGDKPKAEAYGHDDAKWKLMPVYLSIKKPFTVEGNRNADVLEPGHPALAALEKMFGKEMFTEAIANSEDLPSVIRNRIGSKKFRDTLQKNGYDGFCRKFSDHSYEWVAFEPEQIKSATGNRGTFDPHSANITESLESKDAAGREHKGKGKGGGEFTGKGGGGGGTGRAGKGASSGGKTNPKSPAKGGKVAAKAAPAKKPTLAQSTLVSSIKPSKDRAFHGEPIPTKTQLGKQESGKIGEEIVLHWLRNKGFADAGPMNTSQTNFPIDMFHDHATVEIKTGLVSNRKDTQRWRLTIGEPGKTEKEWLAKASPEEKAEWNANKQKKIHERKEKILKELSKEFGKPIKAKTITVILNPDTKTADVYEFDGWHDRIGWNSDMAKQAYKGSVKYERAPGS